VALTPDERHRVRAHLGYLSVSPASSLYFSIPRPAQTLFLVEDAMSNLLPVAEDRVRNIINILDGVECKLVEAQDRLAATQLGDLHLRDDEPDKLEREYKRWAGRLADELGVPLYPFAIRFRGTRAGNVPVSS